MAQFEGPLKIVVQLRGEGDEVTDLSDQVVEALHELGVVQYLDDLDWSEVRKHNPTRVKICVRAKVELAYEVDATTEDWQALRQEVDDMSCVDQVLEHFGMDRLDFTEADTGSLYVTHVHELHPETGNIVGDSPLYSIYS